MSRVAAEPNRSIYDDPQFYDISHTPGTASEVGVLERLARRFVRGPRARELEPLGLTWYEPACGTGRYLRVLARRIDRAGADGRLIGVDLSRPMLTYAKARLNRTPGADRVHLLRADICSVTPAALHRLGLAKPSVRHGRGLGRGVGGGVDLAFCLHNSVRHLPTDRHLLRHLRSVRTLLNQRGVYVVGVELVPPAALFASEVVLSGERRIAGARLSVRHVFQFIPPEPGAAGLAARRERVISQIEATTDRPGGRAPAVRTVDSTYDLLIHDHANWARLVERAGLREIAVVDDTTRLRDLDPQRYGYALRVLAVG